MAYNSHSVSYFFHTLEDNDNNHEDHDDNDEDNDDNDVNYYPVKNFIYFSLN